MKQPNSEILIDYLDKKLSPAENTELESIIGQDRNTASDFEYLKLAVETVRLNAIAGKVSDVFQSLHETSPKQAARDHGTILQLYRTSLRIAAILIFIFSSAVLYKYITVSNQSLYRNQFVPYDLSVTRGGEDRDREAEAYSNKRWSQVTEIFNGQKVKSNKSYFLAAVAEMELQHFAQAVNLFQHILGNISEDSSYQEESEYYCALAYLMNHEEAKSIGLLNKIKSDSNHRYYPLALKISGTDLKIIDLKK